MFLLYKNMFYYSDDYKNIKPLNDSINIKDLDQLYFLLLNCYCKDTCGPKFRNDWNEANKTLGQCSITSVIVQDIFGGEIFGVKVGEGIVHSFNYIDNVIIDLTSEQFLNQKLDYNLNLKLDRTDHLKDKEKLYRYNLLKTKLEFEIKKIYLKENFIKLFGNEPSNFFSCGGRFEILGNHTDHNHGKCIAATCNLSINAAINENNSNIINIKQDIFDDSEVDLNDLEIHESEIGKPESLVRGIAKYLNDLGFNIGGFDILLESDIPIGAGVSSSAAYEEIFAKIFSVIFNKDKIDKITLAKAGQFAEINYYKKSCGLLDQIGVSFGGITYIDFKDINHPITKSININISDYEFLLINTPKNHTNLTHLYKKIPDDMRIIANHYKKDYLVELNYESIKQDKEILCKKYSEDVYNRAIHFYEENLRVDMAKNALEKGDINTLLKCIKLSYFSSRDLLKNMYHENIENSPLEACEMVYKIVNNDGACKINGGGFAGSVICLINKKYVNQIIMEANKKYGVNSVFEIKIRDLPVGKI